MQSNLTINNSEGYTFRQNVNNALQTIATKHSGASAPTETFPFMEWLDTSTSPPTRKYRNAGNTAWEIPTIYATTISEGLSGSGVTVDGVTLKDGSISLGTSGQSYSIIESGKSGASTYLPLVLKTAGGANSVVFGVGGEFFLSGNNPSYYASASVLASAGFYANRHNDTGIALLRNPGVNAGGGIGIYKGGGAWHGWAVQWATDLATGSPAYYMFGENSASAGLFGSFVSMYAGDNNHNLGINAQGGVSLNTAYGLSVSGLRQSMTAGASGASTWKTNCTYEQVWSGSASSVALSALTCGALTGNYVIVTASGSFPIAVHALATAITAYGGAVSSYYSSMDTSSVLRVYNNSAVAQTITAIYRMT